MPFLLDVEEIDLSWNDLIGGSLKLVTPHFNHVSRLRILNLSNCGLTSDDTAVLGKYFFKRFFITSYLSVIKFVCIKVIAISKKIN